ncbi:MAG: NAD(+) synthase, partial [Clostridiales bacterium]|nr:NAD(+) synthase [Clostridiales bacterium]
SMPGPGSSAHTRNSARELVEGLGLVYREINITPSVQLHLKEIGHNAQPDAAFENAQARERTQILMDLANMHNGLMLGSGDMSELALGFTTYGGDHMSMYNPNAGLYKSAIRIMIEQAARDSEEGKLSDCLHAILATPISPDLLPPKDGEIAQRTEEIVGPYELIDFYLYHFLLNRCTPLELLQLAQTAFGGKYTRESLLRYMHGFFRRFFASQFKRSCQTDGPQILSLSLSPRQGLRMPSDGSAALWLDEIDQLIETGEQA